jgi:ubiquinone/menaquinone biosynthesis C-methylase UbiE
LANQDESVRIERRKNMQRSATQFDQVASTVFAPVYPLVARQVIGHTGVTRGTCLDVGCGTGYLGVALAELTELYIHFFDLSADMLEITREKITASDLGMRANTIQGDVRAIDLPDGSVNLAVSRGAIWFWEDIPAALREIYRVLAPRGWAYIGGGFGSKDLLESIEITMRSFNNGTDHFKHRVRRNLNQATYGRFKEALTTAGIDSGYVLQNDDIGMWVVMRK